MALVKAALPRRLRRAGLTASALAAALAAGAALASDKDRDGPPGLGPEAVQAASAEVADAICLLIESAATANGLPVSFFTRLIGQESSFRTQVEGPVTRSGERAQGIAQFMPGTAAERGLLDPFDPVQALPRSAEFLKELRERFGNLGLAAAAYNGGPTRVQNFLAGSGGLPLETRDYVISITGHPVEAWVEAGRDAARLEPAVDQNCTAVRAMLGRPRSEYVEALERRVGIGVTQPWGVQLSAGFSKARALMSYDRAEKRFGAVLAGHDPMIVRSLLRSRGTRAFYQIRAGAPSRDEANALCTRLRKAGGACLVLRTGRAPKRA